MNWVVHIVPSCCLSPLVLRDRVRREFEVDALQVCSVAFNKSFKLRPEESSSDGTLPDLEEALA